MLTSDRSAPDGSAERYRLGTGLLLRQWEAGCAVIFDAASNSTHLVDGRAAALLARLMAAPHPLTRDELLRAHPAAQAAGTCGQTAPDSQAATDRPGSPDGVEPAPPPGLDVLQALLQAGVVIEVGGCH